MNQTQNKMESLAKKLHEELNLFIAIDTETIINMMSDQVTQKEDYNQLCYEWSKIDALPFEKALSNELSYCEINEALKNVRNTKHSLKKRKPLCLDERPTN